MRTLTAFLLAFFAASAVASDFTDLATSPTTFAACKTADIVTTGYALRHGGFIEKNPLIAGTLSHGYFPLVAISFGVWELLKYLNEPKATAAANGVTCGVAAHNLYLIAK